MIPANKKLLAGGVALAVVTAGAGYWLGSTRTGSTAGAGAAEKGSDREILYWYDPMIPMERYPGPGKSSMNMELIPKYADEASTGGVKVSPAMRQSLGIRLGEVQVRDFSPTVQAVGRIEVDERRIVEVQTLSPGYVEQLTVRAEGQAVRAGARIAAVYSPDLLTAQAEYVALRKSDAAVSGSLREAARNRLRLLGLPAGAIRRLEGGGSPQRTYGVFAPTGGIVTAINARPGGRVELGQSIVTLADLSQVWAVAQVPENALGEVKVGQPVEVTFPAYPGEVRRGRVDYIYPTLNAEARTARVRITLPNPGLQLKIGMLANMTIQGTGGSALVVPSEAVIATGRRTVVIAARDGAFSPVEVQTGREVNGFTEIVAGLGRGDRIVLSGQFLIDSEASLSGAIDRLKASAPEAAAAGLARATGTIQSLDAEQRRVTIAHGPVPMMNWPAMTMTFGVPNPAMLRGFKRGDRVEFGFGRAQRGGVHVVEQLTRDTGE